LWGYFCNVKLGRRIGEREEGGKGRRGEGKERRERKGEGDHV
jgi:hypothetical protein